MVVLVFYFLLHPLQVISLGVLFTFFLCIVFLFILFILFLTKLVKNFVRLSLDISHLQFIQDVHGLLHGVFCRCRERA